MLEAIKIQNLYSSLAFFQSELNGKQYLNVDSHITLICIFNLINICVTHNYAKSLN